ncbi:MAG: hypothetical protein PHR26_00085 [Candidatus ainarchaeum sp.]|nr:hypothetical protein [Candidatus ainarchaeum sp.]
MIKIDKYYKFIGATFGIAYFIGMIFALFYIYKGIEITNTINFINNLALSGKTYFSNIFKTQINNTIQLMIIPFSYLIYSVKIGFSHISLLTSSFLGQIKLLVELIPQIFYFIAYIIYSTIGLKIILFIIKIITNKFLKNKKIKYIYLYKTDIKIAYIGFIAIIIGTIIQTHLSKILFIFLINLKSMVYIFIIIVYIYF